MATPTVTGAIALYRSTHPYATPAEVRAVLRGLGNQGWKTGTDPDKTHEPLLDVHRIGGLGDFGISLPGGTLALDESGGPIPITISRTPDAFEPVVFSVAGLPAGATATITPSTPGGFDADAATLRVNLPSTIPSGTVHLTVTGTIQGRSRSDDVAVSFTDKAPVMGAVARRLRHLAAADGEHGAHPRVLAQGGRPIGRDLGLRGRALGRRWQLEQGGHPRRPDAELPDDAAAPATATPSASGPSTGAA